MVRALKLPLIVILFSQLYGCSLYMQGAWTIEKISRMESDRYIVVDLKLQLDEREIETTKYFTCEQHFKADAGAGVMESWKVVPSYTTLEGKDGGFWVIEAPACERMNLELYPSYITRFSNNDDLHPKVYLISSGGPIQKKIINVFQTKEKPTDFIDSTPDNYSKDNYYKLIKPSFINAYVDKRANVTRQEEKYGVFNTEELTFFGTISSGVPSSEHLSLIGERPLIQKNQSEWGYIYSLSNKVKRNRTGKSTKITLNYQNGLWVFPEEQNTGIFDSRVAKTSGKDLAINYKGYVFSPYEITLIYDPETDVVITFGYSSSARYELESWNWR